MKFNIIIEAEGRDTDLEIKNYEQDFKLGYVERDDFRIPVSVFQMFKDNTNIRFKIEASASEEPWAQEA